MEPVPEPESRSATKYKLTFYVPAGPALEACKDAIFAAGAGRYPGTGNYTECCWMSTPGIGQFRPGDKANPFVGEVGKIKTVEEVLVETLCVGEETVRKTVAALKE